MATADITLSGATTRLGFVGGGTKTTVGDLQVHWKPTAPPPDLTRIFMAFYVRDVVPAGATISAAQLIVDWTDVTMTWGDASLYVTEGRSVGPFDETSSAADIYGVPDLGGPVGATFSVPGATGSQTYNLDEDSNFVFFLQDAYDNSACFLVVAAIPEPNSGSGDIFWSRTTGVTLRVTYTAAASGGSSGLSGRMSLMSGRIGGGP